MKIGEVIKQYREERNLSQREFGRRCDLSNAQISWLEIGIGSNGKPVKPTFDTVRKVAKGMGISAEQLITQCEDFDLDLTDTIEQTTLAENFVKELSEYTPDERMLIQAYRMIPAEHQLEALEAILKIKAKYEK